MLCPDASELQAFLDGSLSAERAGAVEEHMDRCAGCRKTVSTLARQLAHTVDVADGAGAADVDETAPLEGLRRGQRVDHFEILEALGRGGMGRVYLARDTRLDRKVALKVLHAAPDTPERLEQLMHEARTTARFNHPNIVTIHQVGEVQGRPYLALEHLEGQTLQQRLRAGGTTGVDDVLQIGMAVARALTEAHASQVLHRDLKPSNVMLVGDDLCAAKVLDFGLAFSEELTAAAGGAVADDGAQSGAGIIRGTPSYMAPEQWNAQEVTPAADIWALGVMLYELTSGRRPFEGRSLVEQAQLVNASEPCPTLPPELPEGLVVLIERCLSRRPGQRPSAAEVLRQLERIRASLRGARQRRRRAIVVITALALVAVAALVAALVIASQKREAQRQRAVAEARQVEAQRQRAEAQREGARRALLGGDLLEARARLRVALEIEDTVDARVLWWRLSGDPLRWKQRFAATVNAAAFLPDGAQLAVAVGDAVHLLDAQTGARRRTLEGHRDRVMALSPASDGARLASASWDGEVRLWDLHSGSARVLASGGRQAAVYSVRFSPDGRRLAAACRDHAVRIWDLRTRTLERRLTCAGPVLDVRFGPGGKLVFAGTKAGEVLIWDRASGTRVPGPASRGVAVMGLALDPRGALLASAGMDGTLHLWDLSSRSPRPAIAGLPSGVTSVAFGPGSTPQLTAGLGDGSVRLWRLQGRGVVVAGRFAGHQGTVWGLGFSPDGAALASGGVDRTVRSWIVGARPRPRPASHGGAVLGVDFSLDGAQIATGCRDGAVRIWRARDGQLQRTLLGHASAVWGVAFSPRGTLLATGGGDGSVRLWDGTGRQLRTLSGHAGPVWDLRFSADGAQLASAGADKTARLWEVASGRQRQLLSGHEGGVRSVRFSRDGRQLVTGSYDHTVRTWRVQDGLALRVLRGHTATVYGAAFAAGSRDRVVSSSSDGTIRRWDLTTGRALTVGRHRGRAYQLDADPTGPRVLVAGSDGTARIWSLEPKAAMAPLATLTGHRGELRGVRYSRDGATLATTSVDGTLRIWSRGGQPRWRAPQIAPQIASQIASRAAALEKLGSWGAGATAQVRLPPDRRCPGGAFAVGYRSGRIELSCRGRARSAQALEEALACAVEQLAPGPGGTVVAGSACGTLGLWSVETGKRLVETRLHGPVVQLAVEGGKVRAATEIGAHLTWDLQLLLRPRCAVLESVWREVPVAWEAGRAVVRTPPSTHRCRQ